MRLRDFGERDRRAAWPFPRATAPSTMSSSAAGALQQLGGEFERLVAHLQGASRARRRRSCTVARAACAPMPWSMRSVWPWTTRMRR